MYFTESCVVQSDMESKVQKSNNSDTKINVESIDNLIYPQKVNIIKMDVEGSEIEALLGASKTIQKHSPKLIISAYHKSDDLYLIPLIIKKLIPTIVFI
jgi:FkbM family methyltransferase